MDEPTDRPPYHLTTAFFNATLQAVADCSTYRPELAYDTPDSDVILGPIVYYISDSE